MATGAAYLRLRRQKAKRLLEEQVEGIETERRGDEGELVVVDSATDARLATLGSCEEAAEPEVDLPFTPRIRVEYRTDATGTEAEKLGQIRDRLTAAASAWRW